MKIAVGFVLGVFVTLVVFIVVFCILMEKRHPETLSHYQRVREQEQKNASHRETYSLEGDDA